MRTGSRKGVFGLSLFYFILAWFFSVCKSRPLPLKLRMMDDLVDNEEKNHQGKKQLQQSPEKKKKKAALLLFQLKNPSGIEGVELLLRKTCRAERRKCFCMINGHEGPFLAQLLLLLYSQVAERVNLSKQRKLFNNIIQTIFFILELSNQF